MSTPDLLATVMAYPLLGNVFAYNTPMEGVAALRGQSDALDLFLRRADAAEVAVGLYSQVSLVQVAESDPYSTITIAFLELLLAHPELLGDISVEERRELVGVVVAQWDRKRLDFPVPHYGESESALVVLRSAVIDIPAVTAAAHEDEALDTFLRTGAATAIAPAPGPRQRQAVLDGVGQAYGPRARAAVERTMPPLVAGFGWHVPTAAIERGRTTIYTPKRTAVLAWRFGYGEHSAAAIRQRDDWVRANYRNATVVRSATVKYNCHSYAWHSQAADNLIWLDSPSDYWKDGSYTKVVGVQFSNTIPSSAPLSARIYYVGGNHSAIKYSNTLVTSKWGLYGLVRHPPAHGPFTGTSNLLYYGR